MRSIHVHPVIFSILAAACSIVCGTLVSTELPAQQDRHIAKALKTAGERLVGGDPSGSIALLYKADAEAKDPRVRQLLASAHASRGLQRFRAKKVDLAWRDYSAANRLLPGNESILQSLGVISLERRRSRDAESFMLRVLKINPTNHHALSALGRIAYKRDNHAAASAYLERAVRAAPERNDYKRLATKYGKEAKVEEKFVTVARGNFRVQFERGNIKGVDKAVNSVHAYLEQAYRELAKLLGARPSRQITRVHRTPSISNS